jgi:hypothetical protein
MPSGQASVTIRSIGHVITSCLPLRRRFNNFFSEHFSLPLCLFFFLFNLPLRQGCMSHFFFPMDSRNCWNKCIILAGIELVSSATLALLWLPPPPTVPADCCLIFPCDSPCPCVCTSGLRWEAPPCTLPCPCMFIPSSLDCAGRCRCSP